MIAYLDMPSGISGDIFLGCLVDAGWSVDHLRSTVEKMNLPTDSWSIHCQTVMRGPLRATLVDVAVQEGDQHRHLHHIREIIEAATLPTSVKERAFAVFTRLAHAEANVHGTTVEQIHFHEVGALDAIIDIVGTCAGLHELGIDQLYASGLPLGEGWINSAHGRIPLPAPATLILLADAKAPTRPAPGPGELVTPTGAALVAELATFSQPRMKLQRIGTGTGQKDFPWPNVARLWLGEALENGGLIEIETNIDDMNPELYGAVSARLFAAGALDVWTTPIQMKKGRPATLLSVLAPTSYETLLTHLLLTETTTLGVRIHPVYRHEAERKFVTAQTSYGEVRVKLKLVNGEVAGAKPEFEDCLKLAEEQGAAVRRVYEAAQVAAGGLMGLKNGTA